MSKYCRGMHVTFEHERLILFLVISPETQINQGSLGKLHFPIQQKRLPPQQR